MTSSTEGSRAARSAPRGTSKVNPALAIAFFARTIRCAIVASLDRKARAISSVVRPPTTLRVSAARASGDSIGWQAVKMRPSSSSPRSSSMAASIASAAPSRVRCCTGQRPRDFLVLALAHLVAPEGVDGAPFGDGHQPGARIVRHAGPRPLGQGDDQRVLRQLLGKIDIPHHAGQARDEPGPFNAKGRLYCLMRLPCAHTAFSSKAAGRDKPACRAEAR